MSDGKGCKCAASSAVDCGCPDVDWTPQEVYDLRAKLLEAQKEVEGLKRIVDGLNDGWNSMNTQWHEMSALLESSKGREERLMKALEPFMDRLKGWRRMLAEGSCIHVPVSGLCGNCHKKKLIKRIADALRHERERKA